MKKRIFIFMILVFFAIQVFPMSKRNDGIKVMGSGSAKYLGREACTIAGVGVFQYEFFSTKEQSLLFIFNVVCAKYNKWPTHSSLISTSPDNAFVPQEVIDMMKKKKANICATYMGGALTINVNVEGTRYNSYKLQILK